MGVSGVPIFHCERLVKTVEKLMTKKGYKLEDVCDLLDVAVEEYNTAKQLVDAHK